jgi:3-(3-hydroxy-phenyl)propionate hydroxylase
VLMLAKRHVVARRLVNSGRLSVPATHTDSPLKTLDAEPFAGRMAPGSPAIDAPVTGDGGQWLLDYLGNGFTLVIFTEAFPAERLLRDFAALGADPIGCSIVPVGAAGGTLPAGIRRVADTSRMLSERYDAREGTTYLFRPDQHVCARWRTFGLARVRAAIARATGQYLH